MGGHKQNRFPYHSRGNGKERNPETDPWREPENPKPIRDQRDDRIGINHWDLNSPWNWSEIWINDAHRWNRQMWQNTPILRKPHRTRRKSIIVRRYYPLLFPACLVTISRYLRNLLGPGEASLFKECDFMTNQWLTPTRPETPVTREDCSCGLNPIVCHFRWDSYAKIQSATKLIVGGR